MFGTQIVGFGVFFLEMMENSELKMSNKIFLAEHWNSFFISRSGTSAISKNYKSNSEF